VVAPLLVALLVAQPSPAQAHERSPVDGWRHALSLGWDGTSLWSKQDSHYTVHSLAASYLMSTADGGVFLHVNLLFPLQARQDGEVFSTGDYYGPALGLDLLVGWAWRWELPGRIELEAGPGLHASLLALTGKTNIRSFNAAPLGIGAQVTGRWRPGVDVGEVPLSVGVVVAPTVDFWDPLHTSQLEIGLSLRTGVTVGLDLP
jgi:hypothetical protein